MPGRGRPTRPYSPSVAWLHVARTDDKATSGGGRARAIRIGQAGRVRPRENGGHSSHIRFVTPQREADADPATWTWLYICRRWGSPYRTTQASKLDLLLLLAGTHTSQPASQLAMAPTVMMASSATAVAPFQGLKSAASLPVARRSTRSLGNVSNGGRIRCMQVTNAS